MQVINRKRNESLKIDKREVAYVQLNFELVMWDFTKKKNFIVDKTS